MKLEIPKLYWTEKPNGTILSFKKGGATYNTLISYTTPICTAVLREGKPTQWFKHPSHNPKARSRTTMTHFNQFVAWMGEAKGSVVLDDLQEAEVA